MSRAYASYVQFPDHIQGNRWGNGGTIGPVLVNGSAPAGDLSRVVITFKRGSHEVVLDSNNGDITIDDAATWEASIVEQPNFLYESDGTWEWDADYYETGRAGYVTYHWGRLKVFKRI